ncbi:hypothetical protein VTO73DRAFT_5764 [Trametes versicolor]
MDQAILSQPNAPDSNSRSDGHLSCPGERYCVRRLHHVKTRCVAFSIANALRADKTPMTDSDLAAAATR